MVHSASCNKKLVSLLMDMQIANVSLTRTAQLYYISGKLSEINVIGFRSSNLSHSDVYWHIIVPKQYLEASVNGNYSLLRSGQTRIIGICTNL